MYRVELYADGKRTSACTSFGEAMRKKNQLFAMGIVKVTFRMWDMDRQMHEIEYKGELTFEKHNAR